MTTVASSTETTLVERVNAWLRGETEERPNRHQRRTFARITRTRVLTQPRATIARGTILPPVKPDAPRLRAETLKPGSQPSLGEVLVGLQQIAIKHGLEGLTSTEAGYAIETMAGAA